MHRLASSRIDRDVSHSSTDSPSTREIFLLIPSLGSASERSPLVITPMMGAHEGPSPPPLSASDVHFRRSRLFSRTVIALEDPS